MTQFLSYLLFNSFVWNNPKPAAPSPPPINYVYNSMFSDAPLPSYEGNDGVLYNIGTLFKPLVDGDIVAFKIWRTAIDPSTSIKCNLWDASTRQIIQSMNVLCPANYSGWITQDLAVPFPIVANKRYVIANNNSYYAARSYAIPGDNYIRDKLNAIDGVYGNSPNYPAGLYQDSNYYVDIVFRYINPVPTA